MASSEEKWKRWQTGVNGEVWGHPALAKEFGKLPDDARASIQATMKKKYCAFENVEDISDTRLKSEGRHGSDKIHVWAFKGPGGRVYGAQGTVNNKRAFFATNAVKKQKQKADQSDLEQAANRLDGVTGEIPGAKLS